MADFGYYPASHPLSSAIVHVLQSTKSHTKNPIAFCGTVALCVSLILLLLTIIVVPLCFKFCLHPSYAILCLMLVKKIRKKVCERNNKKERNKKEKKLKGVVLRIVLPKV
jgi:membrane protein implicated in regulation of membrane protease activity